MKKLTVITPMNEMQAVVRRLVRLRCVEVRQIDIETHDGLLMKASYDSQKSSLEASIAEIDKALPMLNKYSQRVLGLGDSRVKVDRTEFISDGSYDNAKKIVKKTNELICRLDATKSNISSLEANICAIEPWSRLDFPISIKETKKTKVILGSFPVGVDMNAVKEAIGESYVHLEEVSTDKTAKYCCIISLKTDADDVFRSLVQFGFVQIQLPDMSLAPSQAIATIKAQIKEVRAEVENIINEIRKISDYLSDVEVLYDIEKTNLTNIAVMQKTANTERCTFVTGWVPDFCQKKVENMLDKHTCAYEMAEPDEEDNPPVHLKNNGFASTFEWVIGMYSYPKYGSFDPTFIMSIFYFFIRF